MLKECGNCYWSESRGISEACCSCKWMPRGKTQVPSKWKLKAKPTQVPLEEPDKRQEVATVQKEIQAMNAISQALGRLDREGIKRVLTWIVGRFCMAEKAGGDERKTPEGK